MQIRIHKNKPIEVKEVILKRGGKKRRDIDDEEKMILVVRPCNVQLDAFSFKYLLKKNETEGAIHHEKYFSAPRQREVGKLKKKNVLASPE